jgi:hypothetical protein
MRSPNVRTLLTLSAGVLLLWAGKIQEPDLLADVPADIGLFGLGRLRGELEAILGVPVDLVPARGLKPDVRARAEGERVAL